MASAHPKSGRTWASTSTGRLRTLIPVVVTALVAVLLGHADRAMAATNPPLTVSTATLSAALHCPTSFTHPGHEPVLLVHGTGTNYQESWSWGYAEGLGGMGYDVCGVDLPGYALGDIQDSAEYVVYAIDRINAATGRKVDVVGHSQGNLELRWAVKWWPDLWTKVDDMVYLGSPAHGIVAGNLACVIPCGRPAYQMRVGSNLLTALNNGDETPGPISYTSIYSYTDEAVVPWWTAVTNGATNIAVQSVCPGRIVTHGGLLYDAVTFRLVVDALSHAGPASPGRLPFGTCLEVLAPGVSAVDVLTVDTLFAVTVLARIVSAETVLTEPALKAYAL
jgi:triacylglycerol lipase